MPVRDLLELLRRQGEALGPNSWNGTRLAKRASERFREIAVIKSRTNRFIWPAAVEGTKSRFVRFKTKDDLLKQVGTALAAVSVRTAHQPDEAVQGHANQEIYSQTQIDLKHAMAQGSWQLRLDSEIDDIPAEHGQQILGPAARRGDPARHSRIRFFPAAHARAFL